MSVSQSKVEADSTSSEQEVKEEDVKPEEAPSSENGKPEKNGSGLSAQLEEKIIRQVEVNQLNRPRGGSNLVFYFFQFYFGDRNFPRDKFLQKTAAENEGGCILAVHVVFP